MTARNIPSPVELFDRTADGVTYVTEPPVEKPVSEPELPEVESDDPEENETPELESEASETPEPEPDTPITGKL